MNFPPPSKYRWCPHCQRRSEKFFLVPLLGERCEWCVPQNFMRNENFKMIFYAACIIFLVCGATFFVLKFFNQGGFR